MKRTERLIAAVTTIALGVLLVVLRGDTIKIITSTLGIMIVVLGVLDFFGKDTKLGIAKCVIGALMVLFGFFVFQAILYILAGGLVVLGVWWIYDLIKCGYSLSLGFSSIAAYLKPILLIVIGILLCFHQGDESTWLFVVTGAITVVEGGLIFVEWLKE